MAVNPQYKSQAGHLFYAQTLEALGNIDAATKEYKTLCLSYAGPDLNCKRATAKGRLTDSRRPNTAERLLASGKC